MLIRRVRTWPWAMLCAGLLTACTGGDAADEAVTEESPPVLESIEPIVVYTVNYPLAYFTERIGGELVDVEFPAPPDTDPAFWSPGPEAVAAYQTADLILLNGAGYAGWTSKVSLPESRLVNTSAGFEDRYLVEEEAVVHTHGPEGEHEHQNVAFTTWLDATLAVEHARSIRDALVGVRPEAEAAFEAGLEALEADLMDLDRRLLAVSEGLAGAPVLGSHPVFQYLAHRYSLNLRSVHFEPGEEPGPAAWRDLVATVDRHAADLMLWEDAPLSQTEDRLRDEHGIRSVVFEPAGNRPASGDYLSVMRANVERLEGL